MAAALIDAEEIKLAHRAARRICRGAAGDLYFATFFLPRNKRRALYAIGAFCAMIVEAIDLPERTLVGARAMREHPVVRSGVSLQQLPAENLAKSPESCDGDTLQTRIEMLRARLDEIYAGTLELPAVASRSAQQHALIALSQAVREFEIDRSLFVEFAEGCRIDRMAERFNDPSAVEKFVSRCGGTIGVMISSILGATHSDAREHAIALGSAIRLTHELEHNPDRLPEADLSRLAHAWYRSGAEGICWLADDGSRLAVATATVFGSALLRAIDAAPRCAGARLTAAQKLLRMSVAVRLARRLEPEPLPRF